MAKKANGRSLSDFGNLLPAETVLLEACLKGEFPPMQSGTRPDTQKERTEANRIRVKFLRFLLLGGDEDAPIHEQGVQLRGAWIDGTLDLEGALLPHDVLLENCWIDGNILLVAARTRRMELDGSRIAELSGDGAKIEGDLFLRNGFLAEGKVKLDGAKIAGDLDCKGARFEDSKALAFNRAEIEGIVFLSNRFEAEGMVTLIAAKIRGDLDCNDGKFKNPDGYALLFEGAKIDGHVFLGEGFSAEGEVNLANAKIGGHFDCRKGTFKKTNAKGHAHALVFDGAEFGACARLNNDFSAIGVVRLHGARIKGDLSCQKGTFIGAPMQDLVKQTHPDFSHIALSMNRARVTGRFFLRDFSNVKGNISLAHTHVDVLFDDAIRPAGYEKEGGQPGDPLQDSYFYLDGFTYDRLHTGAPVDWSKRRNWLKSQPPKLLGASEFRPQPWEQISKVLRDMGHLEQARKIAIAKQDHVHEIGKGIWYTRPFHWLYGKLAGYGHRPSWLAWWMFWIWLGCGIFYYWGASEALFGPSDPRIFNDQQLAHCRPDAPEFSEFQKPDGSLEKKKKFGNWSSCPDLPHEYTSFSPLVYSLDLILPVVSLGQVKDWRSLTGGLPTGPSAYRDHMGLLIRTVTWLENLFGWAASLLMVATLSGLVKKDDVK